jgi:hypothetical protein
VSQDSDELPDAPLPQLLLDLSESLRVLRGHLDSFRLRLDHFAADLTLYGFLLQAWENGTAVVHLVTHTNLSTASFPNTRACFEAGEDALYLVTEGDYDSAGARARVYERLEQAELRDEMNAAFNDDPINVEKTGFPIAEATIEADAARWDEDCPGKGQSLRDALAYLQPKFDAARHGTGKHPANWTEKSRRGMAKELEKRVGEEGFGTRLIATYAHLSRNSHPRLRLENWQKITTAEGGMEYVRRERTGRLTVGVAEIGVKLATMAMERRP